MGQLILVIWSPAGDNRVYTAPDNLGKLNTRKAYIRQGSETIVAQGDNLRRLQDLTARIPFDDRINQIANIRDFDLGLIQEFLYEVKSDLYEESKKISFDELCRQMHIAKGASENLRPINAGLLLFTKTPEQFFDRTWIEMVDHTKSSGKKSFTEKYFKGAIHKQLENALQYLETNVLEEKTVKTTGKAKAGKSFNYPYEALEEALSNAVYHKSYEIGKPIEIQIFADKITILSYPGPVPPVDAHILATQKRIVARDYRNRRIGDFLKELGLTEGRSTGIPLIYSSMEDNGSTEPLIETNDASDYFLVNLPVCKDDGNQDNGIDNQDSNQDGAQDSAQDGAQDSAQDNTFDIQHVDRNGSQDSDQDEVRIIEVLHYCLLPQTRYDILENLGMSNHYKNYYRYIKPAIEKEWLVMTIPDKPNSRHQKYKTTTVGKIIISTKNI